MIIILRWAFIWKKNQACWILTHLRIVIVKLRVVKFYSAFVFYILSFTNYIYIYIDFTEFLAFISFQSVIAKKKKKVCRNVIFINHKIYFNITKRVKHIYFNKVFVLQFVYSFLFINAYFLLKLHLLFDENNFFCWAHILILFNIDSN